MKKILMTLVAVFATMTMSAESMYVGGTLGYTTNPADAANDRFTIAPQFGVNFDETWGVGAVLSYTNVKDTRSSFTFNPYVRYQALKLGKFDLFLDGGVYFTTESPKGGDADNFYGLNVRPGISYNLTEHIALTALGNSLVSLDFGSPAVGDSWTRFNVLNNKYGINDFRFGVFYTF